MKSKIENRKSKILPIEGFLRLTKHSLVSILIVLVLFVGTGLIYLFNPFTKSAEAAWVNDNWGYRHLVTFTHNADISADRAVTFTLDTAELITAGIMQSDCDDTRFTGPGGNLLYFDLTGTCNNATTTYEVIFPKTYNGVNLFYVYYGNPAAVNTEIDSTTYTALTPSGGDPSLTNPTSSGNQEKAPSPTLYWKFEDDTIGTAQDSTTNNLDGTHNNTPTIKTDDFCVAGKCLYFDGISNENVSLADNAKLDFVAADNFTLSVWVKSNSSTERRIIHKTSVTDIGYWLTTDGSNNFCFKIFNAGLGTDAACSSGTNFTDNQWHHVVGMKTGTSKIEVFVDGVLRGTDNSIIATGTLENNGKFLVGIYADELLSEMSGYIDEVKVYNFGLSEGQIKADYASRSNPTASATFGASQNLPGALSNGLLGYWKMDETSGNLTDSSGNSNTGTNTGTSVVAGKFGSSRSFDGVNNIVTLTTEITPTTLSWWINPTTIISKTFFQNSAQTNTIQGHSDGTLLLYDGANRTTSVTINTSSWQHFVLVWKGSTTYDIYKNGVFQQSVTSNQIPVGYFGRGSSNGINGKLDEVRAYNRALSNSEVSQLYNFAPVPKIYYKFDEGSGTTVNDSSGNGNGTTLVSGSYSNGKFGHAYNLNGTSNYSNLSTAANFSAPATVSFWVKSSNNSCQSVYSLGSNAGSPDWWEILIGPCIANGVIRLVKLTAGVADYRLDYTGTPSTELFDNKWHFISVTMDGTTVKTYIDGVQKTLTVTNGSNNGAYAGGTYNKLAMGVEYDTELASFSLYFLNGSLDDVKVYNYARTAGQIIEDMNGGHPAPGSPVGSALGHYRFDEGADNTCSGGTNDICNSGNGGSNLDGTLTASSRTLSGKSRSAFDGGDNKRATITDNASLDFSNGSDDFTISAWFNRAASIANDEYIIDKHATNDGYTLYMDSDGDIVCGIGDGAAAWIEEKIGDTLSKNYDDGAWHQAACVKSGTASLRLYVDGVEIASDTSLAVDADMSNASALYIGDANATDGTDEFLGDIDEVKIYRSALTAEQIKMDKNLGSAQVLGSLGNNSNYDRTASNQIYCIPADATSCTGPVGNWDFEENSGTTAFDTSTTGNDCTLTNNPTYTTGRNGGAALQFDGSDDVCVDSSTSSMTGLTSVTLEAWIYPTGWGENNFGVILRQDSGSGPIYWNIMVDNDGTGNDQTLQFFADWDPTDGRWTAPASSIILNTWNHVAATYDGSSANNSPQIYINGRSQTVTIQSNPAGGSRGATQSNIYIGNGAAGDRSFSGKIDQVRVFNYIRNAAQIAYDYNRGAPTHHWRMDECQGTTINDSSGNGKSGTLTIGATGEDTVGTCTTSSTAWGDSDGGGEGKRNYAISLDGSDDYIQVNSPTLPTGDFTYSAWIYPTSSSDNVIFMSPNSSSANEVLVWMDNVNGKIELMVRGAALVSSSIIPSTNSWTHIAVSRSGANGKVYINGLDYTVVSTTDSTALSFSTCPLGIGLDWDSGGCTPATPGNYFNGKIDDARIYNYALTSSQVKLLYNEGAVRFGPNTGAP